MYFACFVATASMPIDHAPRTHLEGTVTAHMKVLVYFAWSAGRPPKRKNQSNFKEKALVPRRLFCYIPRTS